MSKRRFWTDEEMTELRRRYEAREPQKCIAHALGRSLGAVKAQISEYRDIWAGRCLAPKPAIIGDIAAGNDDRRHLRLVAPHGGFAWLQPAIAERLYAFERSMPRREFWRPA